MSRLDELEARHGRQADKMGIGQAQSPGKPQAPRRRGGLRWMVPVGVVVLGILAWLMWPGYGGGGLSGAGRAAPSADGLAGTGTGFFISDDGWLVTAAHVVGGAEQIVVFHQDRQYPARVVRIDGANDVALLKVEGRFRGLPVQPDASVRIGDPVFTVGFPLPDIQGQSPKLTRGDISSVAGIQDDPRHFQISVPVQPGNSGGPLSMAGGAVIGVIVSRLDDTQVYGQAGVIPQNVNYALKSSYLLALLSPDPGPSGLVTGLTPGNLSDAQRVEAAVAIIAAYGSAAGTAR